MRQEGAFVKSEFPRTLCLIEELRHASVERPGGSKLSLSELGALVISAGVEAGFAVTVEHPVQIRPKGNGVGVRASINKPRRGKLDCCWSALSPETSAWEVVVAWEFDGRDVGVDHVQGRAGKRIGTIEKLAASEAPMKFQALYSYRPSARSAGELGPLRLATERALDRRKIPLVSDDALIRGEILEIAARALRAAGKATRRA